MSRIRIITVARKAPEWVKTGYDEYNKRLPREFDIELREISPARRGKGISLEKTLTEEARDILAQIPQDYIPVLLDEKGGRMTTLQLSKTIEVWQADGQNTCFIIGGPDGVHHSVESSARERWRISDLTLPHALVRVLLIEQIYRAWSIITNHPYHRE